MSQDKVIPLSSSSSEDSPVHSRQPSDMDESVNDLPLVKTEGLAHSSANAAPVDIGTSDDEEVESDVHSSPLLARKRSHHAAEHTSSDSDLSSPGENYQGNLVARDNSHTGVSNDQDDTSDKDNSSYSDDASTVNDSDV